MIDLDSIHSLTDFKRNTGVFMNKIKVSRNPLVLTVNGRAELVVLDTDTYQNLLNKIEYAETVQDLKEAMVSFERGEGRPAREALEELADKYDIPS